MAENNLAPTETAFIGHMVHDVEAALRGGVMSVATLTSFDSCEKLGRASPDVIVSDLGKLRKLLEAATPNDEIRIEELELLARAAVPDEERAQPQRLTVSVILQSRNRFDDLADDLARTTECGGLHGLAGVRFEPGGQVDRDAGERHGGASIATFRA